MAGGLAGRGRDRVDATEVSEGSFTVEPGDVLAGGHQELAGILGADAERAIVRGAAARTREVTQAP